MRAARGTALPLAALAVGVAALPLLGSVFADTVMALAGLFAIVAVGLNLLFGYAGKISFGHNAFMAMGAYASGILTTGAGLPPLGALVAGAAGTGLVAFLLPDNTHEVDDVLLGDHLDVVGVEERGLDEAGLHLRGDERIVGAYPCPTLCCCSIAAC